MNKKRGFTLIELLVVIAIIALLMSILMPALAKVRKQAMIVVCESRLKQWGVIFSMYTNENDSFFHARLIGTQYYKMWPYFYKPYYKDPTMRFCPAAENTGRVGGSTGVWNLKYGSYDPTTDKTLWVQGENGPPTGSFGMSRFVENIMGSYSTDVAFWRRADIKGGDKVPVFFDCQYNYNLAKPEAVPPEYDGDWSVGDTQAASAITRHGDGFVDVLFMDWSVRRVGLKELWMLKWSRTYDTCGPWTICGNGGGSTGKTACAAAWDAAAGWMKNFPEY
jgi:prepilin-type N-terminal cleavage/methylation domain-containing protein